MKPISEIRSTAVPLRRSDVDTDQIIPSEWLKQVERTGFGKGLFSEWREDPTFVLNDSRFSGARILIAGPNFGVGSSREHAVWSLMDYGFDAIISPRFGDIFRNNSTKVGLVPVQLMEKTVERIMEEVEAEPRTEIYVDIRTLTVTVPSIDIEESFYLDEFTKHRFIEGLDDIGLTLRHIDEISQFEETRASWLPSARSSIR